VLGLVLIFFVGKAFYDLAGLFKRSQWGYAILGIISYYGGSLLLVIPLLIAYAIGVIEDIETIDRTALNIISIPFGGLTCWLTYRYLKNAWSKPAKIETPSDVLDADFLDQNKL
jgi:hypothetical protein